MDDIGQLQHLELELELTERDHQIASLRQQVFALKARLGEEDEDPSPPPSSSPPDSTPVIQALRSSLREITADRDNLLQALATTRAEQASLQARLSDLEDENGELLLARITSSKVVEEEKERRIAGEETIAMLRSTVEEARRGVMRLQTEKSFKRTSSNPMAGYEGGGGVLGIDGLPQSVGGAHPPSSFFSSSTPPTTATSKRDKRASLNVGYGVVPQGRVGLHRRMSSISDSAVPFINPSEPFSSFAPAPLNKTGLRELRLGPAPPVSAGIGSFLGFGGAPAATPTEARRVSTLSASGSPSNVVLDISDDRSDAGGSASGAVEASRFAAMRKLEGGPAAPVVDPAEMDALRAQMGALQSELVAAKEAREASETACRALREFIAFSSRTNGAAAAEGAPEGGDAGFGSGAGVEGGMLLPPLPSDMEDAEDELHTRQTHPPPPPPPAPTRTWMGGLFGKKDPKTTPDPSLAAPSGSPPLPQNESFSSPPVSSAFVSSWSRGVSQAGAISPPLPGSAPPPSMSPAIPLPKSKFSFFSSTPTPLPVKLEPPSSSPASHSPPPAPLPPHDKSAPDVPSKTKSDPIPPAASDASPPLSFLPEDRLLQATLALPCTPPPATISEATAGVEPSVLSEDEAESKGVASEVALVPEEAIKDVAKA